MEQKLAPQFTKDISDRTVVGIFAVHGNIDDGGDRSFPGSFADVKVSGRDRARFLWMHRAEDPPVAVIESVKEVARDALPSSVLSYAPDAMGGVEVVRRYLKTPRGEEILEGIREKAIDEMSYAYDVTNSTYETVDGVTIRNILGVKLYDISDVTWGMNPATVASKGARLLAGLSLADHSDSVRAAVAELSDRFKGLHDLRAKEGRTFSAANMTRLSSIREALAELSADLDDLLTSSAPKADPKEAQKLFADFQRIQAALNGVTLS